MEVYSDLQVYDLEFLIDSYIAFIKQNNDVLLNEKADIYQMKQIIQEFVNIENRIQILFKKFEDADRLKQLSCEDKSSVLKLMQKYTSTTRRFYRCCNEDFWLCLNLVVKQKQQNPQLNQSENELKKINDYIETLSSTSSSNHISSVSGKIKPGEANSLSFGSTSTSAEVDSEDAKTNGRLCVGCTIF